MLRKGNIERELTNKKDGTFSYLSIEALAALFSLNSDFLDILREILRDANGSTKT